MLLSGACDTNSLSFRWKGVRKKGLSRFDSQIAEAVFRLSCLHDVQIVFSSFSSPPPLSSCFLSSSSSVTFSPSTCFARGRMGMRVRTDVGSQLLPPSTASTKCSEKNGLGRKCIFFMEAGANFRVPHTSLKSRLRRRKRQKKAAKFLSADN